MAQHHHERPDGRGYPHGLPGRRIALLAKMGAVCDVYDAITSNRPYKNGWDPAAAMQAMATWADAGQFDIAISRAFQELMGTHPIGSLVRLRSERLAVVNAKTRARAGGLSVTVFYCLRSQSTVEPDIVDLCPGNADAILAAESNLQWRFRDLDKLWAGDIAQDMLAARVPAMRSPHLGRSAPAMVLSSRPRL